MVTGEGAVGKRDSRTGEGTEAVASLDDARDRLLVVRGSSKASTKSESIRLPHSVALRAKG